MKLRRKLAALLICALVAGSMPTVSFAAPLEEGVESEYSEDEGEAADSADSEEADVGDDKDSEESGETDDSEDPENSGSGEKADSEESEDSEEDAAEDAGKSDEAEDPEEAEESAGTEDAGESDEAAEAEDSEGSEDEAETKESDSTEEGKASEDTVVTDETSEAEESAEEEETFGTEESSETEEETSDTVDETDDSADGELADDVTASSTEAAGEELENVLEEELTVGIMTAVEEVDEVEDPITADQIERLEDLIDKGLALVEDDDSRTELAACIAEAEELIEDENATSEAAEALIEQLEELIDDAYANVTLAVEEDAYVLMNIPYVEFYAEEADEGVDAYSSATKSKTRGTLAAGSYHEDDSGKAILGVVYPVKLTDGLTVASLSDCEYTEVKEDDYLSITVNNRGQDVTTEYNGSEVLFERPSYSYYVLDEKPDHYKEVSMNADGELVFGAAQGTVTTVTDASLTYSDTDRHVDHALTVGDFDDIADDTVYGVVLHTATGNYGLRHITNIWRVYYLGWDEGDLDGYYDSLVGDYVTSITYYTSSGIYELELDKGVYVGTGGYVLMNIPYAEFYAEEADEGVDAYTSATLSKPRGTLAAGSYHEDASGEAINGIIYPVKLTGDLTLASLSDCTQITDDSNVTITVTNRGQEVTTTYDGSDALFESPSYSYYILSETPSYYKELSVDADGNWIFGAAQGTVTTVTDASLTYTDTDRHVDHALTVGDFDTIADDTVYGVVLHTATGNYGLRHITNIWRVYYLGWDEGDLDGYYDSLVGDYVTSITYYTSTGIYELTFEEGVYVGNVIIIDGVEVITDALYNEDGSIDLTNTELFSEGADGAYLVTVGGVTQLVGNTTLEKWVGSYENWQSWIYPSEELLEQYPYLEEAWDLAYEAYIAAFEAYGMGDYIKALYPDTDSLKAYWYGMTDTYGVEYMEVEETADGSYVLSWLDADGNVLASDSYTMTGKVLNGLEGAIMYVFTADNLDEGSEYKYWVTMEPDMEGTTEFPIAAHFHFQYGSDIESLLVYGQLYNDTTKNIANKTWYATMIDADADALAKYNVILGMHLAEKWSELPEEDDDLNHDNTGDESSSNTDNTGDSGNSGESSGTSSSSSSSSGRPASSNATSHGSSSGGSGSSSSASSGSTWVQDVENDDNTWWLRRTDGSYVAGSVTTDENGNAHEQVAWAQVNGAWYAFGSDGYADQGWVLDYAAGKWYFIDINTGMKSGWHHDDQDNYWYYLDPSSGAMRIGWNQIDGNWYYFNSNPLTYTWNYDESTGKWVYDTSSVSKPLGAMYAGETTPDGYAVDENGVWVQ